MNILTFWPSGLRRRIKAPVHSWAQVRTLRKSISYLIIFLPGASPSNRIAYSDGFSWLGCIPSPPSMSSGTTMATLDYCYRRFIGVCTTVHHDARPGGGFDLAAIQIMIEIRPAGGATPDRSRDQNADEIPPPASSLSAPTLARTPA